MNTIITRHKPLVNWFNKNGIFGEVIPQANPNDIIGKHIFGVLPIDLAALAESVSVVIFENIVGERKIIPQDYTIEQMEEWGAKIHTFKVYELNNIPKCDIISTIYSQYVEYFNSLGIFAPVTSNLIPKSDMNVFGTLTLDKASLVNSLTIISLPNLTMEDRKRMVEKNFTLNDLINWGACLKSFKVKELKNE